MLTDVLKIIKLIFEAHPKGAMDPPDDEDQGLEEYNKEVPLTLRLFELNVAYLMVRYGEINLDPPMMAHVFSVLQHVQSGDSKCILLSLDIIKMLIQNLIESQNEDQMKKLVNRLQTYLKKDLETCSKDLERENSPERPDNQRSNAEMPKLSTGRWD